MRATPHPTMPLRSGEETEGAPRVPTAEARQPAREPALAAARPDQPALVTLTQTGKPPIRLRATPIAMVRIGSEERPSSLLSICCYGRPNGGYAFQISQPPKAHPGAAVLGESSPDTPSRPSLIAGTAETFDALASRLHHWSRSGDAEPTQPRIAAAKNPRPNARRKGGRKPAKKGGPAQLEPRASDTAVDLLLARFHGASRREQRARLVGRLLHMVFEATVR